MLGTSWHSRLTCIQTSELKWLQTKGLSRCVITAHSWNTVILDSLHLVSVPGPPLVFFKCRRYTVYSRLPFLNSIHFLVQFKEFPTPSLCGWLWNLSTSQRHLLHSTARLSQDSFCPSAPPPPSSGVAPPCTCHRSPVCSSCLPWQSTSKPRPVSSTYWTFPIPCTNCYFNCPQCSCNDFLIFPRLL